ncbi:methyltransferase domain-containing protein [Mycobacterium sp. C3-094]
MSDDREKLSRSMKTKLRCPVCAGALELTSESAHCQSRQCSKEYPIVRGRPVLINDSNSVFQIDDFVAAPRASLDEPLAPRRGRLLARKISNAIPSGTRNLRGRDNYKKLVQLLVDGRHGDVPQVLVVGSGPQMGEGMESLVDSDAIELIETDVAFGPSTALICDAHDIPFESESFDAVVAQAVLEHVADPYRCVEEMFRVLKSDGLIYAETPFMQQVHMGAYDFTRFTHLGHRRLFRRFTEIDSGIGCGPGMALAWSFRYFLYSFTTSPALRGILKFAARLVTVGLPYFDPLLSNRPAAYDSASGFYFLGRKSGTILSDRLLIEGYRGAIGVRKG